MTLGGTVPEALMTVVAAATVFSVMFAIGLGIVPREFRWVLQHSGLVARGLFSVLIAVPVVALAVASHLEMEEDPTILIVQAQVVVGVQVEVERISIVLREDEEIEEADAEVAAVDTGAVTKDVETIVIT